MKFSTNAEEVLEAIKVKGDLKMDKERRLINQSTFQRVVVEIGRVFAESALGDPFTALRNPEVARARYQQQVNKYFRYFLRMNAQTYAEEMIDCAANYINFFKYRGSFCSEFRSRVTMRIALGLASPQPLFQKAALSVLLATTERQNREELNDTHREKIEDILAIDAVGRVLKVENLFVGIEQDVGEWVDQHRPEEIKLDTLKERALLESMILGYSSTAVQIDEMSEYYLGNDCERVSSTVARVLSNTRRK